MPACVSATCRPLPRAASPARQHIRAQTHDTALLSYSAIASSTARGLRARNEQLRCPLRFRRANVTFGDDGDIFVGLYRAR